MTIDMTQFRNTFLEESYEGLETLEQILVNIDVNNYDTEIINTIFRVAHSIKGGSGTFGFDELTELTHLVETLLDEIRNEERDLTVEAIEIFLQSVDCLRQMLDAYKLEQTPDMQLAHKLEHSLHGILAVDGHTSENSATNEIASCWYINFKPDEDIFHTGNDPLRYIKDLNNHGKIKKITVDISTLPPLYQMNPEHCYLGWAIELEGKNSKAEIEEVFEWIVDSCSLQITDNNSPEPVNQTSEVEGEDKQPTVTQEDSEPDTNKQQSGNQQAGGASIRVDINKIDTLLNMVGELVITQSMLCQLGDNFDTEKLSQLQEGLGLLSQNTRELQESVMKIRMLPISFIFNRVPRMVYDISKKLDKDVELKITGENTELDKTVMEKLSDPLTHLVRNSLDHGIETPDKRTANGKNPRGTLQLNAYHQGGNIIIEIIDDGAGINIERVREKAIEKGLISSDLELSEEQIINLIFQPGFSTAATLSDISGRGVGMDVVRRNIQTLGGRVNVTSSPGEGSKFSIQLPLTLAILDGQLFQLDTHTFVLPLISIVESIQIDDNYVETIKGGTIVYRLREEYVPIISLIDIFELPQPKKPPENQLLVIVESNNHKIGILVDELLAQQQVVIKSLETNYKKIDGVSGATILGDGTVALIIDVTGVVNLSQNKINAAA